MKATVRILGLALTFVVLGCGAAHTAATTSSSANPTTAGSGSTHYAAAADAICRDLNRDSRRLGHRFGVALATAGSSPLALTTKVLVEPAIGILERNARRLRSLEPGASSEAFDAYVSLFDPIVALSRDRAQAGLAGNAGRARELELLLINLIEEQRQLAARAGLSSCQADFFRSFTLAVGSR